MHGHFHHLTDPLDDGNFDNMAEMRIIAALTELDHNLVAWQSECIVIWRQLVEAVTESNHKHPGQQATVKQQYLELFAYLAEGVAEGAESVLMPWEIEYGKPDQKETIAVREVLLAERMMQQEGHEDLDPGLEQYITTGGGMAWVDDMKQVSQQGVPILHYEKGLLKTVMDKLDYGESDLLDQQHTLFLKDLMDQQVYDNTNMLEQVTDLVRCKMLNQLPEMAWEVLHTFEFGEGEEAIRMLHKYLESAHG